MCVWEIPKHQGSFAICLGMKRSHEAVGKRASLIHHCNSVEFLRYSSACNAIPWCPLKLRTTHWVSNWFRAVGWGGRRAAPAGLPGQLHDVIFSERTGSIDHHAIRVALNELVMFHLAAAAAVLLLNLCKGTWPAVWNGRETPAYQDGSLAASLSS